MPKSRKQRPSSTPGKQKGQNCQKSELKTLFCKDTRLHRTNPKLWMACVRAVQRVQNDKGNANKLAEIAEELKLTSQ